jgi:hypothetical protein
MNRISTGFGLALLAGAILAYPFVSSLAPRANASAVTGAASAFSAAATGQTGPTVVWYGWSLGDPYSGQLMRAWSDGRVENMRVSGGGGSFCGPNAQPPCVSPWFVVSSPNQGYNAASDINFDSKVDGSDLGQLLAAWGNAPRQDIPLSDCPLNLVNP